MAEKTSGSNLLGIVSEIGVIKVAGMIAAGAIVYVQFQQMQTSFKDISADNRTIMTQIAAITARDGQLQQTIELKFQLFDERISSMKAAQDANLERALDVAHRDTQRLDRRMQRVESALEGSNK